MNRRARDKPDVRRTVARRQERPKTLVVTEGQVTEVRYLNGLAQYLRATGVTVSPARIVGEGRDPLAVVERAVALRKDEEYDSCWAVIGVDQHVRLEQAVRLAKAEDIFLLISNPCFELWLLWHFVDHSSHTTAAALTRALRQHGFDGKSVPRVFPYPAHQDAVERAENAAPGLGACVRGPNPSSSVALLVLRMARGSR